MLIERILDLPEVCRARVRVQFEVGGDQQLVKLRTGIAAEAEMPEP